MGTFLKTFFICLILSISFLVYKFVLSESYNPDLAPSKDNPVFNYNQKFDKMNEPIKQNEVLKNDENEQNQQIEEKYSYKCYFYSSNGKLAYVTRDFSKQQSLQNIIQMLLKGPTIQETKLGLYSEIPKNVDVISVKTKDNKLIINLTSAFGEGGGSQSVENRVKQLSKTIKANTKIKNIYLYIDNKEVEYLGGEGVYIKQPLE